MKRILIVLLFCLILENNVSTKRTLGMKMLKSSKEIKDNSNSKVKNLRKLELTDDSTNYDFQPTIVEDILIESELSSTTQNNLATQIIETSTPSVIQTTQNEVIPSTIIDDQLENIIATAENLNVSSTKPLSIILKTTKNKKSKVQFLKFFEFKTTTESIKVTFDVYFYFLERSIPYEIIIRLRINYLELKYIAESARTFCLIANTSLAETDSIEIEGKSVRYNCELNATIGNPSLQILV